MDVEDILAKENYKLDKVKHIKHYFDQGYEVDLSKCEDFYIVGELLKAYFRELPNAIASPVFDDLMKITGLKKKSCTAFLKQNVDMESEEDRKQQIISSIKNLNPLDYSTLALLIMFLAKLSRKSGVNKMTVDKLGSIFGPHLVRAASPI